MMAEKVPGRRLIADGAGLTGLDRGKNKKTSHANCKSAFRGKKGDFEARGEDGRSRARKAKNPERGIGNLRASKRASGTREGKPTGVNP